MQIIFKTFPSVSEAYAFLDQMIRLGHEPLELSPIEGGCRVLLKAKSETAEDSIQVSDAVLKAYLGLNDGKVRSFFAVVDESDVLKSMTLAESLRAKGIQIHEIRSFRHQPRGGYMIVSHDDEKTLKTNLSGRKFQILSTENKKLIEFLGFSNITVN